MTNDHRLQDDTTILEKAAGYGLWRRTDTSEAGLESLIVRDMLDRGWLLGNSQDYDRGY